VPRRRLIVPAPPPYCPSVLEGNRTPVGRPDFKCAVGCDGASRRVPLC